MLDALMRSTSRSTRRIVVELCSPRRISTIPLHNVVGIVTHDADRG